jgi:hypothetical protein
MKESTIKVLGTKNEKQLLGTKRIAKSYCRRSEGRNRNRNGIRNTYRHGKEGAGNLSTFRHEKGPKRLNARLQWIKGTWNSKRNFYEIKKRKRKLILIIRKGW